MEWIERHFPDRKNKIMGRFQSVRGGKLNSSEFKTRMVGTGILAQQFRQLFQTFATRLGLNQPLAELRTNLFRPSMRTGVTNTLFLARN
jgi:hypothetical protein